MLGDILALFFVLAYDDLRSLSIFYENVFCEKFDKICLQNKQKWTIKKCRQMRAVWEGF